VRITTERVCSPLSDRSDQKTGGKDSAYMGGGGAHPSSSLRHPIKVVPRKGEEKDHFAAHASW